MARLIAYIEGDLRRFDFQLKAIEKKEQSLQRLRIAFANGGPEDAAEFLDDIVREPISAGIKCRRIERPSMAC